MGGPAMIEGGGLGVHDPRDVGPIDVQHANGVVDLRVADEAAAVGGGQALPELLRPRAAALRRRPTREPCAASSPSSASAMYDIRAVIEALTDEQLELRRRLRPRHRHRARARRGPPARDRRQRSRRTSAARSTRPPPTRPPASCSSATRSSSLCCSSATRPASWSARTPSSTATVRHFARLFVTGANLTVPVGDDRPAQGLRARRAVDGRRGFKAPLFTVGWPTSEFGGMGLEGAVRLGHAPGARGDRGPGRARARLRRGGRKPPTSTARA